MNHTLIGAKYQSIGIIFSSVRSIADKSEVFVEVFWPVPPMRFYQRESTQCFLYLSHHNGSWFSLPVAMTNKDALLYRIPFRRNNISAQTTG
jgi:hypothetical protein